MVEIIIFEKIYDEQVKKLNENRIDFIDQQIAEPDIEPDFPVNNSAILWCDPLCFFS